jgi:hypothetical protein
MLSVHTTGCSLVSRKMCRVRGIFDVLMVNWVVARDAAMSDLLGKSTGFTLGGVIGGFTGTGFGLFLLLIVCHGVAQASDPNPICSVLGFLGPGGTATLGAIIGALIGALIQWGVTGRRKRRL